MNSENLRNIGNYLKENDVVIREGDFEGAAKMQKNKISSLEDKHEFNRKLIG